MDLSRILLRTNNKRSFICGANVPWLLFAEDVVRFPRVSRGAMGKAMDDIRGAGGNVLRFWLHINGRHSPTFSNGKVTGLHPNTVPILNTILDMAQERGLMMIMCLWSFDMLKDYGQDRESTQKLLTDVACTRLYIEKALLPILEGVGSHPAVLTWEVFNEPEGMTEEFGWTEKRIRMIDVQRTVNLIAGAIHRYRRDLPVSNGAWTMSVSSDVDGFTNYYSDQRLLEAGGDTEGYLDLYQVHYYPLNFENNCSPFHNTASHWALDKPIIIGEFPNMGCTIGKPIPNKTTSESFQYAYENGYAGCLAWRWPYEVDMGSFKHFVKPAIQTLRECGSYLGDI